MAEIDNLFGEQYKIYGYLRENTIVHPTKLTLYKVARVLRGYNYVDSGTRGMIILLLI
ncbi:MAG: hypothetical protein ACFFG0_39695 [Candidatus Thorarchaeota archaeon]